MRILRAFVAAAYALSSTVSYAADGAGHAVSVVDVARAAGQAGDRPLTIGASVFVGDLVKTDANGEAQLLFQDGTRMVVGSNSSLVIEEFLFGGKSAENRFAVQALGGAFRFISGEGGDKDYSIRTPSGSISVRGTAFDFTVVPGKDTKVVLLEDEVTLCKDERNGEEGECETVATPCAVLRSEEDDEKVEEVGDDAGRQEMIDESFPYVRSDKHLREDFQVAGHGCASGGLAQSTIAGAKIPTAAIIAGAAVLVIGGAVILLKSPDSNNKTNN